jgi:hypothetical protein
VQLQTAGGIFTISPQMSCSVIFLQHENAEADICIARG